MAKRYILFGLLLLMMLGWPTSASAHACAGSSKPRITTKPRKPMTSLRNSYKGLKYLSKDLGRDAGLFNWSRLLDGLNARILGC